MAAVKHVRTMATTAIKTVFTSQRMAAGTVGPTIEPIWNRGALRLENSTWKLRSVSSVGHQAGVAELICAGVFKAPVMIQYSGKINRMASKISTTRLKMR